MELKNSTLLLLFTVVIVLGKIEKHDYQFKKIHQSTEISPTVLDSTKETKFIKNNYQTNDHPQIRQSSGTDLVIALKNLRRNKRDAPCIPGKKIAAQTINPSGMNSKKIYTVSSIMESLNVGTNNITYTSDPNIILLLGLSGVGKSTFSQYIAGDNSNLIAVKKKDINCKKTNNIYIHDTTDKIGHGAFLSHTELPDLIFDPETNTTIYDCPGFSDTRDPDHDISGAYFIKAISNRAKAIKLVFVVNYNSVISGAGRKEFMELAKHATNMIENISKYNKSIALVATKIKDSNSDYERMTDIASFLQEVRIELSETNKEPNVQTFIDILLTTDASNNTIYPRIGLMPKFETEGPLISMPAVQAQKQKLRNIIHNNIKYTQCDASDIKPTISSESVIYIDGLVKEVTKQIWLNINNVVQKVQKFYDDLIQNMLDKIHCFSYDNCKINMDRSEAVQFLTQFDRGSKIISEVVKQTENITDLENLSKFIITSKMISEVNISREIISNFSTQQQYLKFLITLGKSNDSLGVGEWKSQSLNLVHHLKLSRNDFDKNISNVAHQIKSEILSIDSNVMNEVQKNFSRLPGNILDDKKLFLMLNPGYSGLREIHTAANDLNITYKCIYQIQRTLKDFNFGDTDLRHPDNIFKKTSKFSDYLDFLQTLKYQSTVDSLDCSDGINRVISFVDDLIRWYSLLVRLFEKLSDYSIQANTTICHSLSRSIMNHKAPVRVNDVIPSSFIETCFSSDEFKAANVHNIIVDEIKLDALKRIINSTLSYQTSSVCDPQLPDRLVVKGLYVKLSDIERSVCSETAKFIEIFALKKIFIDRDLKRIDNKNFYLTIISPIWDIRGEHKIILDGKDGGSPTPRKANDGFNVGYWKGVGEAGQPGLPGGPGGNFFGIGAHFIGSEYLSISANGGSGGAGQDGGDGVHGASYIAPEFEKNFLVVSVPDACKKDGYYVSCNVENIKCKDNFCIDFVVDTVASTRTHIIRPKYENYLKNDGTSGGHGGKGGEGGYPGNITIIALQNNESIIKSSQVGRRGPDGIGGHGGRRGSSGTYESTYHLKNLEVQSVFNLVIFYDYKYVEHGSDGLDGIDGYNTEGIIHPDLPSTPLDFSQNSIINYKTYVHEYLSDGMKNSDMTSFLNFLETN